MIADGVLYCDERRLMQRRCLAPRVELGISRMSKILIVDDDKNSLEMLTEHFARQDYEVETAHCGETALEKVKKIRPHIMLLNVQIPGIGGVEALKQAKEADPRLGVIMTTGFPDEEIAQRVMTLGAYDYITKPIDLDYLNLCVSIKVIDMVG